MKKTLVPLLMLGILLLVLGLLYGRRVVRGYQLHQTISGMLQETKSGNIKQVMSLVSQPQRQQATKLTVAALGPAYHTRIHSLRLTDTRWLNDDSILATVTCKLDYEGVNPIYQGRLLWRFGQGGWVWDFAESYVGEYAGLEEPAWVKLGEMLSTVESY